MRCVAAFLLLVAALPWSTSLSSKPAFAAPAGFVYRSGNKLFLNGSPYTFKGLNIFSANSGPTGPCGDDNSPPLLDTSLTEIDGSETATRAWFFQNFATSNGARNWTPFDQTLSSVASHGIKIIVTFSSPYGTNLSACADQTNQKDYNWFTGGYKTAIPPGLIQTYRDYVHDVVQRYAGHSEILMWQIMNEAFVPSCPSESQAAQALRGFADDMAGMIHSLDPNHLISLGTGGPGCGIQGSDYSYVHASTYVDLCEYHDYGQVTVPRPAIEQQDMDECAALNKAFFVGEVGIPDTDLNRPSELNQKLYAQSDYPNEPAQGILVWEWGRVSCDQYCVKVGDPVLTTLKNFP